MFFFRISGRILICALKWSEAKWISRLCGTRPWQRSQNHSLELGPGRSTGTEGETGTAGVSRGELGLVPEVEEEPSLLVTRGLAGLGSHQSGLTSAR